MKDNQRQSCSSITVNPSSTTPKTNQPPLVPLPAFPASLKLALPPFCFVVEPALIVFVFPLSLFVLLSLMCGCRHGRKGCGGYWLVLHTFACYLLPPADAGVHMRDVAVYVQIVLAVRCWARYSSSHQQCKQHR
ncbi:hypothetical protein PTSG_11610 [Salpingoeca rosetta]|uniref:Uncharacterized protein n=1 Tax=Salpingoeca rosetta (strain ATCC 50818 / BSB-021) TaxID=946362 RepID=F2TWS9_SALR5|nr:uncharacterized protein PTSG_11610 [Salpingoeca rosetta]EGD72525.1 hypothetical protein PTSG_11610 [Salpingoeca rosetta]|eukprot:XP_004999094.1 hypothetical protein PTSG_11610 [Salpingoeca rosetta]